MKVTPQELRQNAELFYALRDARNNLRIVVPSDSVPLSIVADSRSLEHCSGQQLILTIINTLLRSGRRFGSLSIDMPDVPLSTTVAGISSTTMMGAVLELGQKVDPHARITEGQKDYGFAIAIGSRVSAAPHSVYVGIDGSNVVISKNPLSVRPSNAPVSAVIAANCAVAEAYKHFTPSLRVAPVGDAVLTLPAIRNVDIGHLLLAGAGGISNGLAWILQWLEWHGSLVIVDFDPIDTSNLNRYFCAFVEDIGADKPATLASFLSDSQITVHPLIGSYESLRDTHRFDPGEFSHIITAVDNVPTRLEVQSDLPRSIVNAGTNAWSFEASRHSFGACACLACMFPPTPGVNYGRRVRCGERTDGTEQAPVESYSFVNGLSGAYLALELAAATKATNSAEVSQHYHGSGLHVDSILAETRNKDSQCVLFCDHPEVAERYRTKYERASVS
jgi:molybdopterin/thiamine biosynthesis adenylyltransferase